MGQEKSPTVSERDGKLEPRLHTLEVMVREAPIGIAYWFQGGSLSNQRHMPLSGGRNLIFFTRRRGGGRLRVGLSCQFVPLAMWPCPATGSAGFSELGPRRCRWLMPRPRPGAGRESESPRVQVCPASAQLRVSECHSPSVNLKHNAAFKSPS